MDSFTYIISSFFPSIDIFKISKLSLSDNSFHINGDLIIYGFIYSLHLGKLKKPCLSKFTVLDTHVTSNLMIVDNRKEQLFDAFCKAQRAYYGFCRLARLYKFKKAKRFSADTDLFMNSFDELPKTIIIKLYDDASRTIYKFRMSDLLNIINTGLSCSESFFAEPYYPKNPYTNVKFTKAQLYYIYYKVKKSKYIMCHLFHMFFIYDFNIGEYCKYNECYIRELAIKNFLKTGSDNDKHYYIIKMLRQYEEYLRGISIHPNFPINKLIKTFTSYLHHYLLELFSLNPTLRHLSIRKLIYMLKRFTRLNPTFGRRIYARLWSTHQQFSDTSANIEITDNFDFTTEGRRNTNTVYFIDTVITMTPQTTMQERNSRPRLMRHRGTQSTIENVEISNNLVYQQLENQLFETIDAVSNSQSNEPINIVSNDVEELLHELNNSEDDDNSDNNTAIIPDNEDEDEEENYGFNTNTNYNNDAYNSDSDNDSDEMV